MKRHVLIFVIFLTLVLTLNACGAKPSTTTASTTKAGAANTSGAVATTKAGGTTETTKTGTSAGTPAGTLAKGVMIAGKYTDFASYKLDLDALERAVHQQIASDYTNIFLSAPEGIKRFYDFEQIKVDKYSYLSPFKAVDGIVTGIDKNDTPIKFEKKGNLMSFLCEQKIDKESFRGKAGDTAYESASCDAATGSLFIEDYTLSGTKKLYRDMYEYNLLSGGYSSLHIKNETSINSTKDDPKNLFTYVRLGQNKAEFVEAAGTESYNFKNLSIKSLTDPTIEAIIKLVKDAGYTVTRSGVLKDGKMSVTKGG